MQLVVMSYAAFSKAVPYKVQLSIRHPGLRAFAGMAAPTMAFLAVAYVSVVAERVFASGFNPGALSTLSYAMRLFVLPAAIVAGSIATVLHPEFSALASRGKMHELGESFRRGVDLTTLVLIPVSIGALVFSRAVVAVAYGYGKFSNENVETTAATFAAYSLGIIPFAIGTLCQRIFYALRIPRMLLIIECVNLAFYLIAAPVLGRSFNLPGLALARSCSFFLVGSVSFAVALRKLTSSNQRTWFLSQFTRCMISAVPTTLLWIALAAQLQRLEPGTAKWERLAVLAAAGILGSALYLFMARALQCREADNAARELVNRFAEVAGRIRLVKRLGIGQA